jgi:hypothetical protein
VTGTDHTTETSTAEPWRDSAETAVRGLAAITVAGALLGALVGGVGARLAMMLLAGLNPEDTGMLSDDGFPIGRFTLDGSLQLLGAGLQMGLIGAAVYAGVRWLRFGPRWFQVLSLSAGAAVVVGSQLVHTDGIDFTLLQPAGLGIATFVLIPAVYTALLTLLAEHWLRPESWFSRAHLGLVVSTLLLWAALPLLPLVVLGWLAHQVLVRMRVTRQGVAHPAFAWLLRAGLTVVFALALAELVRDTTALS